MRACVTVSAPARLHFGFLDLHGGLGRRFGGLGLALAEPETVIDMHSAPANMASGPQADRAARYLERIADNLGIGGGHEVVIHAAIPEHAGLGSGTQLALAIAAGLRRLHARAPDLAADANLLDRGRRSGLGAAFFSEGGVVLDGGRTASGGPAPAVARLPFPDDWRVLLILDPARQGIHGSAEISAFDALPTFPAELAAHLCRLAVMQALPGLAERNFSSFSRAVTEIQARVGDYFAPIQGGRYSSPGVAALLDLLETNGVEGFGQSSWGPTGFAFAPSPAEAARLIVIAKPLAADLGLELRIVSGRNHGATTSVRAQRAEQGVRHG